MIKEFVSVLGLVLSGAIFIVALDGIVDWPNHKNNKKLYLAVMLGLLAIQLLCLGLVGVHNLCHRQVQQTQHQPTH